MKSKDILLKELKQTILKVQKKILLQKDKVIEQGSKSASEIRSMKSEEQMVYRQIQGHRQERIKELLELSGSPFFAKCTLVQDGQDTKDYYFSKYSFPDENIYSWVAPIASIRFEQPGPVSYTVPGKKVIKSTLSCKDQYMIVDGNVIFYATESVTEPRTLIHQEHFSNRKASFMLPEIVAVMEKAQDKVIRANYKGALAIRGPAGSGKTTLALHRVAYLMQSPETTHHYPGHKILIVVQDTGTKEYFSNLLPELGIRNVSIVTFFEWAAEILNCKEWTYSPHCQIQDSIYTYEHEKIRSLRKAVPGYTGAISAILQKAYSGVSKEAQEICKSQEKEKVLDRIDITTLLMSYYQTNKTLAIKRETLKSQEDGSFKTKVKKEKLQYSLIVVDEFQNYLPEQLQLLRSCVDKELQSIMYVGDMAQQVRLGTIKNWNEIDESITDERDVVLHKVYRNTKQILQYIQKVGFAVDIPEGIKEGPEVIEVQCADGDMIMNYLEKVVHSEQKGIIGIICINPVLISPIREKYRDNSKVHVVSQEEVQGVEFDTVCIVGINKEMFVVANQNTLSRELQKDIRKIQKDLLYISLTRAIREMHIIGSELLGEATSDLFK